MIIEQRFVIASGARTGEAAAVALVRAGLYDRRARSFVPVERLLGDLGLDLQSPAMSPEVAAFMAAEGALRRPG